MIEVTKKIPVTDEELQKVNQPIKQSIFPKSLQINHPKDKPTSYKKSTYTPDHTGGTYSEQ